VPLFHIAFVCVHSGAVGNNQWFALDVLVSAFTPLFQQVLMDILIDPA
jgi:hypothetical protein